MRTVCRVLVLLFAGAGGLEAHAEDLPVSFYREVLPLLRTHCVVCHKPGKLKGGLDLTTHFGSAFTNDGKRRATISRDEAAKRIGIVTGHLIDDMNRTRDL